MSDIPLKTFSLLTAHRKHSINMTIRIYNSSFNH